MKILFCDVDGTILDHTKGMSEISEKTKEALRRWQDEGNILFIASGRAMCLFDEAILSLKPDGFVTCNGAYCTYKDEVVFKHALDDKALDKVREYCRENHGVYFFERSEMTYVNEKNDIFTAIINGWTKDFRPYAVEETVQEYYIAMAALESYEKMDEFERLFSKDLDIRRQHGFSSFDLGTYGVHKGRGVLEVLKYLGIDKEDAYAFGDGLNDLEMIEAVGHGIAMGNADEELKKHADDVCLSVQEDGIYHYLNCHHLI